jgi:hypothetical protein
VDKVGGTYRSRREHAAAAERARLVARDARVEVGRRLRAALREFDLLLGREGHVQQELRRHDPASDNNDKHT